MFKTILFPTDGSPAALDAARVVADLAARQKDLHVTIVSSIAPYDPSETDFGAEMVEMQNTRMRQAAGRALEATSKVFNGLHVANTTKIVCGDPVSASLAKEVNQGKYDLVAMASRGMAMQKDDLQYVGSVTEHLIRRVSVPVLVIPSRQD